MHLRWSGGSEPWAPAEANPAEEDREGRQEAHPDQLAAIALTPCTRRCHLAPGETIIFDSSVLASPRIIVMHCSGQEIALDKEMWEQSIQTEIRNWRWHRHAGFDHAHADCRVELHVTRLV